MRKKLELLEFDAEQDLNPQYIIQLSQLCIQVLGRTIKPDSSTVGKVEVITERLRSLENLLRAAKGGHYELLAANNYMPLKDAISFRFDLSQENKRFVLREVLGSVERSCADLLQLLADLYGDKAIQRLSSSLSEASSMEIALMQRLLPGRQVSDYMDVRQLTSANNKTIFTAVAPNGKTVILKKHTLANDDNDGHRRLKNALIEIRLLYKFDAELNEPGVIKLEGYFIQEQTHPDTNMQIDTLFLQLPYYEDGTLKALSDSLRLEHSNSDVRLRKLLPVFEELRATLQTLHQKGVVHRDVKPSNVLIKIDGSGKPQPVLADFEIGKDEARCDISVSTSRGISLGTNGFRPPEVAQTDHPDHGARPTGAHDVWSLAMMLLAEIVHSNASGLEAQIHLHLKTEALKTEAVDVFAGVSGAQNVDRSSPLATLIGEMLKYYPADRPTMHHLEGRLKVSTLVIIV